MTEYRKEVTEKPHFGWTIDEGKVDKTAVDREYRYEAFGAYDPAYQAHHNAVALMFQRTHLPGSEELHHLNRSREQQGQHPVLFTEGPGKVTSLFSDPKMTHTVPTLLGLAYNDAGGNVMPGDNLSPYSSRLAKKAMKRGWVTPNPYNENARVTNNIPMQPRIVPKTDAFGDLIGQQIGEAELKGARTTIRNLMRPDRATPEQDTPPAVVETKHLSDQFQPTLPGF